MHSLVKKTAVWVAESAGWLTSVDGLLVRQYLSEREGGLVPGSHKMQIVLATSLCLVLFIAGGAARPLIENWLNGLIAAIVESDVQHPVKWDAGDSKPVVIAGDNILVKGTARSGLIETVKVSMRTAPPDEEESSWKEDIHGQGYVPFTISIPAPKDNKIRVLLIEPVPSQDFRKDQLKEFWAPEKLNRKVRVLWRSKGAIAYYPEAQPPLIIEQPKQYGDVWHVKIHTRTATGFATIAVRERGAGQYVVLPPQPVSYDSQDIIFEIPRGSNQNAFDVTPFATESGTSAALSHAIELNQLSGIEVGEPLMIPSEPIHNIPLIESPTSKPSDAETNTHEP